MEDSRGAVAPIKAPGRGARRFLTPIIYPQSVVPAEYRAFINVNPLAALVRCSRRVVLKGAGPHWPGLAYFSAFAVVVFVLGYWRFAKTGKNFADVV